MSGKHTILVICALGYATSTMIKKTICDYFDEVGIKNWDIDCIGYNMSQGHIAGADIIVSSLELKQEDYKVPILNGVALISGIGKDEVLSELEEQVRLIEAQAD